MANINKRNNQINDTNMSASAKEDVKNQKSGAPDTSTTDPFSRRQGLPDISC